MSGNYAYVALGFEGLQVIDVSNSADCVPVGDYHTGGEVNGVAVSQKIAYLSDLNNGLHAIDVSNPTNCARVGGYSRRGARTA